MIFNLYLYLWVIETKLILVWTELRVWQIMNWIADIYVTYFNGTKCQKGLNKWWIVDIIWNEQLCTFILQNFYFTFFAALETIRFLLISITQSAITAPWYIRLWPLSIIDSESSSPVFLLAINCSLTISNSLRTMSKRRRNVNGWAATLASWNF